MPTSLNGRPRSPSKTPPRMPRHGRRSSAPRSPSRKRSFSRFKSLTPRGGRKHRENTRDTRDGRDNRRNRSPMNRRSSYGTSRDGFGRDRRYVQRNRSVDGNGSPVRRGWRRSSASPGNESLRGRKRDRTHSPYSMSKRTRQPSRSPRRNNATTPKDQPVIKKATEEDDHTGTPEKVDKSASSSTNPNTDKDSKTENPGPKEAGSSTATSDQGGKNEEKQSGEQNKNGEKEYDYKDRKVKDEDVDIFPVSVCQSILCDFLTLWNLDARIESELKLFQPALLFELMSSHDLQLRSAHNPCAVVQAKINTLKKQKRSNKLLPLTDLVKEVKGFCDHFGFDKDTDKLLKSRLAPEDLEHLLYDDALSDSLSSKDSVDRNSRKIKEYVHEAKKFRILHIRKPWSFFPNIFQPDLGTMPILQLIQKVIDFVQTTQCDREVLHHMLGRLSLNEALDFVESQAKRNTDSILQRCRKMKGPGSSQPEFIQSKLDLLKDMCFPDQMHAMSPDVTHHYGSEGYDPSLEGGWGPGAWGPYSMLGSAEHQHINAGYGYDWYGREMTGKGHGKGGKNRAKNRHWLAAEAQKDKYAAAAQEQVASPEKQEVTSAAAIQDVSSTAAITDGTANNASVVEEHSPIFATPAEEPPCHMAPTVNVFGSPGMNPFGEPSGLNPFGEPSGLNPFGEPALISHPPPPVISTIHSHAPILAAPALADDSRSPTTDEGEMVFEPQKGEMVFEPQKKPDSPPRASTTMESTALGAAPMVYQQKGIIGAAVSSNTKGKAGAKGMAKAWPFRSDSAFSHDGALGSGKDTTMAPVVSADAFKVPIKPQTKAQLLPSFPPPPPVMPPSTLTGGSVPPPPPLDNVQAPVLGGSPSAAAPWQPAPPASSRRSSFSQSVPGNGTIHAAASAAVAAASAYRARQECLASQPPPPPPSDHYLPRANSLDSEVPQSSPWNNTAIDQPWLPPAHPDCSPQNDVNSRPIVTEILCPPSPENECKTTGVEEVTGDFHLSPVERMAKTIESLRRSSADTLPPDVHISPVAPSINLCFSSNFQ